MSRRRPFVVIACFAFAMLTIAPSAPVDALPQQAPSGPLDETVRATVVEALAEALLAEYVFEDVAERYAATLRRRLANGDYDEVTNPGEFAQLLTTHLLEESEDRHLRVRSPGAPVPGAGRRRVAVPAGSAQGSAPADGGAPAEGSPRPRRVAPAAADNEPVRVDPREMYFDDLPPETQAALAPMLATQRRRNHHFAAAQILPGNVAYLDYDQFGLLTESRDTAEAAMQFLAGADAFILDLRGNPGGLEGMNQYLASYFFGEQAVHLYNRFTRPLSETVEYWSWPEEPSVRLADVPLFVLVDRGTGSAAENLSFALQGLGRATLVGESTAGGAHSATPVNLPAGFSMAMPISRVFSPRTGEDWEGVGVQPDVEAPSIDALAEAHRQAVARLLESTEDPAVRMELERAPQMLAMRQGSRGTTGRTTTSADSSDAAALEDYIGTYGSRRIWVADGRLMIHRTGAARSPELVMVHIDDDEFTLERVPEAIIRFERDDSGAVVRVHVRQPDGRWETSERGPQLVGEADPAALSITDPRSSGLRSASHRLR